MLHAIAHPALTPHPLRTPLAAILYSVPGLLLSVYFEFLLSFLWEFVTSEGGQDWGPNGWVTGYQSLGGVPPCQPGQMPERNMDEGVGVLSVPGTVILLMKLSPSGPGGGTLRPQDIRVLLSLCGPSNGDEN